ncbi:hypothetical protein D3C81_1755820 [compost metagenome]
MQQGLHLLQALGQHHQQRHCAVGRKAVALVGLEVFGAVQNRQVRQRFTQGLQQGGQVHVRQRSIDPLVVEDVHGAHSGGNYYCCWKPTTPSARCEP